jgi:hypothetical protein
MVVLLITQMLVKDKLAVFPLYLVYPFGILPDASCFGVL